MFFALQSPNTTANWGFYAEKSNIASKSLKNGAHWPRGRMLGGSHGKWFFSKFANEKTKYF